MERRKINKKGWSFFTFAILAIMVICGMYNTLAVTEETSVMTEEDCRNCHNDTVNRHHLLVENEGYNCTDCHLMKWDNDTRNYYPEVIWDCSVCHNSVQPNSSVDPNAPKGAHKFISCSKCHIDRPIEEICYQCHNDPANTYLGFNARTDNYCGMGIKKQFYGKVNTRHDISDEDQDYSSTRLECTNCHSAHLASRENILIDPDDRRTQFNQILIHPGFGSSEVDSITFCLRCHDNTWTADGTVIGPAIIKDISAFYLDSSNKGDEHGAASGSGNSVLIGPYAGLGQSSNIPPMPCTDCHDPHGSGGIYHLRTLTDKYGVPITITSQNINDHIVAHWCSHCHDNPMNQLNTTKNNCLSSACHTHSTKSF